MLTDIHLLTHSHTQALKYYLERSETYADIH